MARTDDPRLISTTQRDDWPAHDRAVTNGDHSVDNHAQRTRPSLLDPKHDQLTAGSDWIHIHRSSNCEFSSSRVPPLCTTKSAAASRCSRLAWLEMRDRASASLKPRYLISRATAMSSGVSTTIVPAV